LAIILTELKPSLAEDYRKHQAILQLPVRLRGREIGKLKLRSLETDRIWSEDEIAMTESIAERAALSLENARLLEVAHRRAAREHTIGIQLETPDYKDAADRYDIIVNSGVSHLTIRTQA
jgi:GAF domain-containing protein